MPEKSTNDKQMTFDDVQKIIYENNNNSLYKIDFLCYDVDVNKNCYQKGGTHGTRKKTQPKA